MWTNHHFGGVMVTVITLSPVDYGYDPLLSTLGRLSQNFVIPAYRPLADL